MCPLIIKEAVKDQQVSTATVADHCSDVADNSSGGGGGGDRYDDYDASGGGASPVVSDSA